MILGTAQAIKIIIFAITVLIGENYRKKFFPKSSRFVLTVGIVLCASIAVYCANRVPPLTDEVTLTALGEHNPEAKKEEIYLNGYTVDGKNYSSGESLQIMDGKWFWNGETYCWRIGTDTRQPKGTTRSIVIRIPVGWERTFNFAGGVWRGKVQVNIDGRQWDVDTYTESPLTVPVQIGRSSTKILIFNQVIRLAVYAMILGALTAILIFLIQIIKKDPVRSHIWLEHHITKIIYGFLALVAFILLFRHADEISLWNDEVAQIQFSIQGIAESLKLCLQMVDITPPLFTICAAIWYGIAPYGEQWLLLPSILFTVLSIYYIGLVGECLGGKYCGILSAVLMAFSTTVWQYIAYEFRAYSFVLLFSTLALYFFILCNQNVEQMKWRIFYSITLTMLAMSHYFGMLACGLFFFADIYLFYKKQIDWKKLGIYILLGAVSLIWLTMVFWTTLRYKRPEQIATWYPVPGISQIQSMIYYLTGNFDLTYWAFLVGIIAAFSFFLSRSNKKFQWQHVYLGFLSFMVIITFLLLLIYGNFINQKSTMWQGRYFTILIPAICILSAQGIMLICSLEKNVSTIAKFRLQIASTFMMTVLILHCVTSVPNFRIQPFRQAADWLYTQSNSIFNDDTLVVTTMGYDDAWNEYYISQKGRRDLLNVKNQYELDFSAQEKYNRIYLQYSQSKVSVKLQNFLKENYILESDKRDIQVKTYIHK